MFLLIFWWSKRLQISLFPRHICFHSGFSVLYFWNILVWRHDELAAFFRNRGEKVFPASQNVHSHESIRALMGTYIYTHGKIPFLFRGKPSFPQYCWENCSIKVYLKVNSFFYFRQNFSLTFSVSGGILIKNYDYKRSSTMIWKNQFLHLTNGDVSAVYGDSALFFK